MTRRRRNGRGFWHRRTGALASRRLARGRLARRLAPGLGKTPYIAGNPQRRDPSASLRAGSAEPAGETPALRRCALIAALRWSNVHFTILTSPNGAIWSLICL